MITLDIVSDVACPWCYVGKACLDRALEARADHPLAIQWHPLQLSPELPREGMSRAEYMTAKFGARDNVIRVHEPLLEQAAKAGVIFDLPAITRTPNTLDAHRLIHWAGLEGRQTPMVARLMRAYWAEGRDIGDPVALAELAAEAGMDRDVTARLLAGDADRDEIAKREAHSRGRGVAAVPTFIIDGQYVLQGAQPTDMWMTVIGELIERMKDVTQ